MKKEIIIKQVMMEEKKLKLKQAYKIFLPIIYYSASFRIQHYSATHRIKVGKDYKVI